MRILIFALTLILGVVGMVHAEEQYTNKLIRETSPYLLQHAHNPVDWYPWGDEAIAAAQRMDKPIFLSIGYSTCHWCHVMEDESFSNPEVARVINKYYIPIKVDREERPDIDTIYMDAVSAMTGSGGWPLTVFLTPDLKPFYGGTYFPPEDRWGRPGLVKVLTHIADTWSKRREEILASAESITNTLYRQANAAGIGGLPGEKTLARAFEQLSGNFDTANGGFGDKPKFPNAHTLSFLLRCWKRSNDTTALGMVEKTLREIAAGGIRDHLGGGFHRYSTDEKWRLPHFEKMLYDQALLARAYLEAYQATGNQEYADVAREIFEYLLRDMRHTAGAFYSAEDADSPDPDDPSSILEGSFYLWRSAQIQEIIGNDAPVVYYYFGVQVEGNLPAGSNNEFRGRNIFYLAHSVKETADRFKKTEDEIRMIIRNAKERLLAARSKRPRPHVDDKILVSWNGLIISSLAFGSRVLDEPRYRTAAAEAAEFILKNMTDSDGKLLRSFRDGRAGIPAMAEDYANYIYGLIDLYEAA
ncbi:MAG: thioredoxin domain-containing protein, partial [Candidatus Omnitrophota bacterium]